MSISSKPRAPWTHPKDVKGPDAAQAALGAGSGNIAGATPLPSEGIEYQPDGDAGAAGGTTGGNFGKVKIPALQVQVETDEDDADTGSRS
jgi:hypothetical protein